MIFIATIALTSYLVLIIYIVLGIRKYRPECPTAKNERSNLTRFSVLIPCRNEEERLQSLFQSIKELEYDTSCFQLMFIDDHSDDATYEMISNFQKENDRLNIKVLKNDRPPGKKSALTCGIDRSEFEHIITTDADCHLPENWLYGYDQHLKKRTSSMVIGPVVYQQPNNFLEQFQHDDFLSLQAVTITTAMWKNPILCNGANLCYRKEDFYRVGGFKEHEKVQSGDDVLLMESFLVNGLGVDLIGNKTLPVITQPARSWKELLHQRRRWSSKTYGSANKINHILLIVIILYSLLYTSVIVAAFIDIKYMEIIFLLVISKWVLDYLMFSSLERKISINLCYRKMLQSSCLYPLWIILLGTNSINKSYIWKRKKH